MVPISSQGFPCSGPVPACLSQGGSGLKDDIWEHPLGSSPLPPSLTVPQPGRMMLWEKPVSGSFLNPRRLSSALSGTSLPLSTVVVVGGASLCPHAARVGREATHSDMVGELRAPSELDHSVDPAPPECPLLGL